ncbi:MAG: hypothetical protein ABJN34_10320 [Litoreibacter sp.]|uniref:hypothetical protein n=1 Tax=Litoreibacter sp. TaxID=1969459 RepID=UPI003298B47A
MTNIENLTKAAAKTLSFTWMPRIRVAVPALTRSRRTQTRVEKPIDQLERDNLMELFQSDLSDMTTLKEEATIQNVVQMRRPRMRPFTGVGQAA